MISPAARFLAAARASKPSTPDAAMFPRKQEIKNSGCPCSRAVRRPSIPRPSPLVPQWVKGGRGAGLNRNQRRARSDAQRGLWREHCEHTGAFLEALNARAFGGSRWPCCRSNSLLDPPPRVSFKNYRVHESDNYVNLVHETDCRTLCREAPRLVQHGSLSPPHPCPPHARRSGITVAKHNVPRGTPPGAAWVAASPAARPKRRSRITVFMKAIIMLISFS